MKKKQITVGVFWYFNSGGTHNPTLIYDTEVYNIQSKLSSEYSLITYSKQHKDAWEDLGKNKYAYDDFPRGRVWYDTEEKHFIVSYDEKLQCMLKEMKEDIFRIFNLKEHNTIWEINLDYRSKRDIFTCRYVEEKIVTINEYKYYERKVEVYLIHFLSYKNFQTTIDILNENGFERDNENHYLVVCDYLPDYKNSQDFIALLNFLNELYYRKRLIILKNGKYENLMYAINVGYGCIIENKEKAFLKILETNVKFINFIESCLFDYCKVGDFLISNDLFKDYYIPTGIELLLKKEKGKYNYSAYIKFCKKHPNWHFIDFDKHIEIFDDFKIKKIPDSLF